MQPTFSTSFYKQAHDKLHDELMNFSFLYEEFNEGSKVLSALWFDAAGKETNQKNIIPLLEQYKLFKETVKKYELLSEERCQSFIDVAKLIEEFGGACSNIEENSEDIIKNNDKYLRQWELSDKSKEKGQEFHSKCLHRSSLANHD